MNKKFLVAILSTAFIISSYIVGEAIKNRNNGQHLISVTGLGKTNFTSDLIVWSAVFNKRSKELKKGFSSLEKHKTKIKNYLIEKGVEESEIVFSSVDTYKNDNPNYDKYGNPLGYSFVDYSLNQKVTINSSKVKTIENISRDITELLNEGVNISSFAPSYYYTKIEELKIELISKATKNARLRAEKIAENAGANIDKVKKASMGVFQITGQNTQENYSWGGTFNITEKEKTALITIKLVYEIK